MLKLGSSGVAILLASSACTSPPTFGTFEGGDPSASFSSSQDMALVPAKTLVSAPLHPTGKGNDDKGKGPKGKNDKGTDPKSKNDNAADPDGGTTAATPAPDSGNDAPVSSDPLLVPSFWIDLREVSAGDYSACVGAGACSAAATGAGCTSAGGLDDHPVNCVSKSQAVAYCTWRKKRLVRNDEWTAAATGDSSAAFVWGADRPTPDRLNACGAECAAAGMYPASDGYVATAPTGSFPAGRSPEGVLDLAGNVAEWVDGASAVRGGSFADTDPAAVTATAARGVAPETSEPTIGFRCARDAD
jgi:formylglycine-generating enzyme required for sulfatase activity